MALLPNKENVATKTTPPTTATTKQASGAVAQVNNLIQGLTPKQKQALLANLQQELAPQNTTVSVGKQKRNSKSVDPADAQLLATAKKQGKI